MAKLSPARVLAEVAEAVPADCRESIIIVGSLAAGYHFFRDSTSAFVQTKDVDCLLQPFHTAVETGQSIAQQLLKAGWKQKLAGKQPPVVRLYPPNVDPNFEEAWFVELLSVADPAVDGESKWRQLLLDEGEFTLPTFRFLRVSAYEPALAEGLEIHYARPQMMALANLLSHPEIKPEGMSGQFAGRQIKRSNKDLGRVLAIAYLANLDDYRPWADDWKDALEACFPDDWQWLAGKAGAGLKALLASPNDLDEAHHTCVYGLLNSAPPSFPEFRAAGERLLGDALLRLEEVAVR